MSIENSTSSLGPAGRERDAARALGPRLRSPAPRSGSTRIPVAPFASLARVYAIFVKELIQLRRDRITFATMIFIPLVQLMLFGYAINTDPKHLPTAVLIQDDSVFTRSFMAALRTSEYFDVRTVAQGEVGSRPPHFVRRGAVRSADPGEFWPRPNPGREALDPRRCGRYRSSRHGNAIGALQGLSNSVFARDLVGPAASLAPKAPPYEIRVHRRYNPTGATRLNIVPGLMGTILTLTMLIFTALSVTREIERGTMESLLSMPIRPVEIMLGKIAPYVMVGAMQMTLILVAAHLLFDVPIVGDLGLLVGLTMLFIVANLSVGYTFSTIATNQLQAMQMSFFFFLPNILLSGFMFPFRGMPAWAQYFGEMLPLTHYLRIVRGVMLKGAGFEDLQTDVFAMATFTVAAMGVAVARFRQTLD